MMDASVAMIQLWQ